MDSKHTYEKALKYVVERFAGIYDKNGYPTVLHSISVSMRVKTLFEYVKSTNEMYNKRNDIEMSLPMNSIKYLNSSYSVRFRYMTLAVLHDLMEDLFIDIHDIEMLFGSQISFRLEYLTNFGGNKNYNNYLERLKTCPDTIVLIIKLLDMYDNISRMSTLNMKEQEFLLEKYSNGRKIIYNHLINGGLTDICDVPGL